MAVSFEGKVMAITGAGRGIGREHALLLTTRLTEGLMPGPKEGTFDSLHPGNISPFVAFLLSDECAFSGQVFVVGGGLVQRAAPWTLDPAWKLQGEARWELDDIAGAIEGIGQPANGDRDTGFVR